MKSLVVYDTSYGNTSLVAAAIAKGLGGDAIAIEVEKLGPEHLAGLVLVVVGSPTQAGRPTASIEQWLASLPAQLVYAAAFDTRLAGGWLGHGDLLLRKEATSLMLNELEDFTGLRGESLRRRVP